MRKQKFPNQTVERLTALRGILNMHERAIKAGKLCKLNGAKRAFDMSTWDCGTAACALGSAALNPWFKERGLTIAPETDEDSAHPIYNGRTGEKAGMEFFGITEKEANDLFFSWNYPIDGRDGTGKVTVSMVRDRVDALIEKYSK